MAQTVAVFGASGQLGAEVARVFGARGWQVHALARYQADIGDEAAVAAALEGLRPAVVVNAGAYNMVDQAQREPLEALRGNALGVMHLARECQRHGARLIHYSTDYVFDGTAGRPYTESDEPHPVSAYGVSKLAGEFYARAYCDGALIIRTSAVYGPEGARTRRGNFVETMLRLAQKSAGRPLTIVSDQSTTPTFTVALAERTADLVAAGATGLVHGGGGHPVSWFDFAKLIFRAAGVAAEVEPIPAAAFPTPARRPPYSALANIRMERLGLAPMPPLAEALAAYFAARS